MVENNELPHIAAIREVKEELSLAAGNLKLLAVDFRSALTSGYPTKECNVQLLFQGPTLDNEAIASITLNQKEHTAYRFVPPNEALRLLSKNVSERLSAVLAQQHNQGILYLEDGKPLI